MTDSHNKSIVGKGSVWYEMSYEDFIKQKLEREAKGETVNEDYNEDADTDRNGDEEDDDDDLDFDYSILGDPTRKTSNQPQVNGTESNRMSDKGMFEN